MKDANGNELKPGDPVLIHGVVDAVCGVAIPEQFPNGTVRASIGAFAPALSLRTDRVVKVGGKVPEEWHKVWPTK